MSETISDTPVMARAYCPGCEPEADPVREILEVRRCDAHTPSREGLEDEIAVTKVGTGAVLGGAEAGGDTNREWCELLHRKKRS